MNDPFSSSASSGSTFAAVGLVLGLPVIVEFFEEGLVPRLPTAVLALGTVIIAFMSWMIGVILDGVLQSRRELKRLSYLRLSPPDLDTRVVGSAASPAAPKRTHADESSRMCRKISSETSARPARTPTRPSDLDPSLPLGWRSMKSSTAMRRPTIIIVHEITWKRVRTIARPSTTQCAHAGTTISRNRRRTSPLRQIT